MVDQGFDPAYFAASFRALEYPTLSWPDGSPVDPKSGIVYTPTLLVTFGGPFGENFWYQTADVHEDKKLARFTPHNLLDSKTRRRQWFREDEYAFSRVAEGAASAAG